MYFLIVIFSVIGVASSKLLSAVVIHRHGDRNPFTTYKTDPYADESHWPEGLGQLTKKGIQRQYDLGLWLKNRYDSFLPSEYSSKSLRALSTDVDRTLMSAEVILAALYPPSAKTKFNEDVNWQPIPVHTTKNSQDPILAMKKHCKNYKKMFDDLLNSQEFREINENNKDLYDFLSNKTGENIRDVYDVEVIHNALHSQFLTNKTLPDWAGQVYPEKMKPAVVLRYKAPCYNKQLARLKIGLLFGEILGNFRLVLNGGNGKKLLLYSGHDATLADVLTTMGAFNDEVPPYSSAVLLELHENEGERYVNTVFKNSTGVYNLTLEKCAFNCSLTNFTTILEPIIQPDELQWEKECGN